jgi:hypothetical protein
LYNGVITTFFAVSKLPEIVGLISFEIVVGNVVIDNLGIATIGIGNLRVEVAYSGVIQSYESGQFSQPVPV